ncbi:MULTISPECIES: signal peptidase II [Cysteiniphilum]|uniref:Lipoprotein signal peptidase n=1 Tax=Cysteiniphilum litorale TaxID=2056700 RepID=A0A8J2Z3T9_9GAMM|nr:MULTISPECIES: signal peptidase II [Cysteiniphilum]GGF96000.1 lipoprotein signal peptidase [Cysteiniphilum litorale]
MSLRNNQLRWVILSIIVIIIDLGTKYLASQNLTYGQPVEILPFFNLTLLHNYGAAFSFLSNANTTWQVILLSGIALIVAIVILIWLARLPKNKNLTACALALILGGALGNVYDRIIHGYVVDFLDFHINNYHWPAFNIADSAICIGAVILILMSFKSKK